MITFIKSIDRVAGHLIRMNEDIITRNLLF